MPERPSALWKGMTPQTRTRAAEAFWQDGESPDIRAQHAEAASALAKRLNFRVRSIQGLPVARRARHLAQMLDLSESIALRALIAYHFANQRDLMAAFLDALGIGHEDGLITGDEVAAPDGQAIRAAADVVRQRFDAADVDLYLRTLAALDEDTWVHVGAALPAATT